MVPPSISVLTYDPNTDQTDRLCSSVSDRPHTGMKCIKLVFILASKRKTTIGAKY
jgi:hypothetical protein